MSSSYAGSGAGRQRNEGASIAVLSDDPSAAQALARHLQETGARVRVRRPDEIFPPRSAAHAEKRLVAWPRVPERIDPWEWASALGRLPFRRLILLSSSEVFAPDAHHPGLVSDACPPRTRSNRVAEFWKRLEEAVLKGLEGRSVAVLRVPVVAFRDGSFWARFLAGPVAIRLAGCDPPLQIVSLAEVSRAVRSTLESGCEGVLHLAPRTTVSVSEALRELSIPALPIPRFVQRWAIALRGGSRLQLDRMEYLRYPWTISASDDLRATGVEAGGSSLAALRELGAGGSLAPHAGGNAAPVVESDGFGIDRDYIRRLGEGLFDFLETVYWRLEVRGLEYVPREGPFILVGIHRGFIPVDAIMTVHVLAGRLGIYPRFMVHPGLLKLPFICDFILRMGGVLACRENARRIVEEGGVLGVFPEGAGAAFGRYREAYRLQRFPSREFLRVAAHYQVPIVPYVTLGPAEALPALGQIHWKWWKRRFEWPCLPIAPPLPLPSKWEMRFLEAIDPPGGSAGCSETRIGAVELELRRSLEDQLEGRRSGKDAGWWRSFIG